MRRVSMRELLLIVLGNVALFGWAFYITQPKSRYERLQAFAREQDAAQREAGYVFSGIRLRSKGLMGAQGEVTWKNGSGDVHRGEIIW